MLWPFSLVPKWGAVVPLTASCGIASALLLGAVWKRQSWARIVLILQLLLPVGFLGIHLFIYLVADPRWTTDIGWRSMCLGVLGLIGTIAWLKLSRRIRYFTSPDGRRTTR